jgi:hypothetical protein
MEIKDIALRQLRSAAKLYNSGDYISSITLSGAAEEIFGQIAKSRTGKNHLEYQADYLKNAYDFLTGREISKKDIINQLNLTRNKVKHNDSGENLWIEADFENEACILFVRAVKNYFDAYKEMPKDRIINNLFEDLTL